MAHHGKIAIVTGGGRGLGRAMTFGLSRAGFRVAITAARSRDEIEAVAMKAPQGQIYPVMADVSGEAVVVATKVHGVMRDEPNGRGLSRKAIFYELEETMQNLTMRPIGFVHSPFSQADQIPRGLGAKHEEEGMLEILPEFEAGLQDVDGFSHLYVLWVFDRTQGYDLVSTPPCDTHAHGVFASRSPRRPNPIGLTVVRLLGREGNQLRVRGVDMLDGTPIVDIKPYLSNVPEAELKRGWLAEAEARSEDRKG